MDLKFYKNMNEILSLILISIPFFCSKARRISCFLHLTARCNTVSLLNFYMNDIKMIKILNFIKKLGWSETPS